MSNKNRFELGQTLKCRITGFTGIATQRVEYINGCIQYCLKPKIDKEGKIPDGHFIDSQQLEFVDEGVHVEAEPTGGPAPGESAPQEYRG